MSEINHYAPLTVVLRPLARVTLVALFASSLASSARAEPHPSPGAPRLAPKPLVESLTGSARLDYLSALQHQEQKDYAGAIVRFQSAYDASMDTRLLFNIADCEVYLRHYARAAGLLHRFLDEGGPLLTAARSADASDLIDKIERFTAALRVTVNVPEAEIAIDNQEIGVSPLEEPPVVDIGPHVVTARRLGFRDAVARVIVDGTDDAGVTLTLQREGNVQADSGVRQDQPRSYDRDTRSRAAPHPREAASTKSFWSTFSLHGLELGLRSGYGVIMRSDSPGVVPLWLDVGVRLGRPTYLGVYAQYNIVSAGGVCGTDMHGLATQGALDLSARTSFQSCRDLGAGVVLMLHPMPRSLIDPWIGFGGALHELIVDVKVYDPAGVLVGNSGSFFSGRANAQLGADLHPISTIRKFGIGPFVSYDLTLFSDNQSSLDQGNANTSARIVPPTGAGANTGISPYGTLLVGVRSAVTF